MYKVCPSCGGEFQQWVVDCPDCVVPLGSGEGDAAPGRGAVVAELPPARELVCIERGDARALHETASRLQQAGISCRIDAYPPDEPIRPGGRRGSGVATSLGLYVLRADAEEAVRLHRQHLYDTLPEAAGYEVAAGAELSACPACGAPLTEGAGECGGCGLAFPDAASGA